MRVIFFLSILCLFTKPTFAKEYYISPSGNDANDGFTTSTPWKSISKVSATTFQPGDKILLQAGGVWSGQLAPKGSGAAGSPIILDMYGVGNKPIINGPASDLSAGFSLTDQSYWNVNNLEITNKQAVNGTARLCGIWVKATLPAGLQNVQIRNCYVHDVNSLTNESNSSFNKLTGGIIFTGYTNEILVKGCRIANVSVEGIRNNSDPQKCEHFVVDSNYIENVYGDGIVYHGVRNNSAITRNICKNVSYNTSNANYAGIWTYLSDTTLVAYNEVYGITGGGVNDGQPFDADINTNGDIFEYNYTHDNAKGFMLFMPSAKNIIVRFNVSVNDIGNVSNNKDLFNYTVTTNNNNKIYNNTFYINANTVTQIFRTGFIGEFSNNILYCTGAVGKFSQAAVKTSSVFNNNCFYPQSITTTNGPAGTMTGNIYLNPRFINAGIHNTGIKGGEQNAYSLNIYSPCLNKGAVISANGNMDYIGTNISGITPSIGAIWPTTYKQWVAKTVPVLEDAYTFDGSANTNFGKAAWVQSKFGGGFAPEGTATANGYSRRTFLKFSTAALKNNTSALNRIYIRVRYYAKDNNYPVNGIKISMSKRTSWVETGITWNTQSTAAGALDSLGYTLDDGYVKQSTAPNPITDAFINASSRYMYLDVTDTILKMIVAQKLPDTISFVLQGICTSNNGPNGITPIGNTGYTYFSREFTNAGGNTVDSLKPAMLIYASNQSILQTNTAPLSVQLLNNRTAKLDWIVNVEQNIDHYNIEKGTDGTNFNTIATIGAQNAGNEPMHYTFADTSVAQGASYYRWNAIGMYDGLNFSSNTVQVNNIINKINAYKTNDVTVKIYPNPVSSGTYFTLQTTTLTLGKVDVEIIDMQGNIVRSMTETIEGTSFLQIPTTELSKGIYLLGVTNGNNKQYVKVVIQ